MEVREKSNLKRAQTLSISRQNVPFSCSFCRSNVTKKCFLIFLQTKTFAGFKSTTNKQKKTNSTSLTPSLSDWNLCSSIGGNWSIWNRRASPQSTSLISLKPPSDQKVKLSAILLSNHLCKVCKHKPAGNSSITFNFFFLDKCRAATSAEWKRKTRSPSQHRRAIELFWYADGWAIEDCYGNVLNDAALNGVTRGVSFLFPIVNKRFHVSKQNLVLPS